MEHTVNQITLRGNLATLPEFSHENHGKRFFKLSLEVPRLSGTVDTLPVIVPESVLRELDPSGGEMIFVRGQIRSFHNTNGEGPRLLIFVFAEELTADDGEPCNEVYIKGVIGKEPVFRRTPLGREICDVMLSVQRSYGRSDYLPCIFWGRSAQEVASCRSGEWVFLTGRLQSRQYRKVTEEGTTLRTAYEISALNTEVNPTV